MSPKCAPVHWAASHSLALQFIATFFVASLAAAAPTSAQSATVSAWSPPRTGDATGAFAALQGETAFDVPLSPVQSTPWSRFSLERLELGGGGVFRHDLAALVRLETVRSASPQSAFGIDRNSLLPRLRLAYGAWTPTVDAFGTELAFTVRAGLVPEPWLERIEAAAATRGLLPLASERSGALSTSDVGVTAAVRAADGVVDLALSAMNGEGKTEVEQNAGKNLQLVLSVAPLRIDVLDAPLIVAIHGGIRDGSAGVAQARDHRALLALTAAHPTFHLGAEGTFASGLGGRSDREVVVIGGWGDAALVPGWLALVARSETTLDVQAKADGASTTEVLAGLFSDLGVTTARAQAGDPLRRLRLYLTGAARFAAGTAAPGGALDAAAAWRVLATLELTLASDIVSFAPRNHNIPEGGTP